MSITINRQPLVVTPAGDLDLESGDALEAVVLPLLEPGRHVIIDLSEVTFSDSSGLGALIAIHQTAVDRGASLVLERPARPIRQILELAGLTDFFTMRG